MPEVTSPSAPECIRRPTSGPSERLSERSVALRGPATGGDDNHWPPRGHDWRWPGANGQVLSMVDAKRPRRLVPASSPLLPGLRYGMQSADELACRNCTSIDPYPDGTYVVASWCAARSGFLPAKADREAAHGCNLVPLVEADHRGQRRVAVIGILAVEAVRLRVVGDPYRPLHPVGVPASCCPDHGQGQGYCETLMVRSHGTAVRQ